MAKKNRYQKAQAHKPVQKPNRRKKSKLPKEIEVVAAWKVAMKNGTFLTPKHDEDYIPTPDQEWVKRGRSVLSTDAKKNWSPFIDSNEYDIVHYDQPKRTIPGSGYFTVTPHNTKFLNVAGSGIPPKQINPTTPLDTFAVVWGPKQGWHLHAESSAKIAAEVAAGNLVSGKKL